MSNFKIGVLSDPHLKDNLQKDAIDKLKTEGAKYLLHLGDLVTEKNLKTLENSKLAYASVFGNNDYKLLGLESKYRINKEPYYLKIEDKSIKMMHLPYYLTPDCDIVLFGHTHQFSVEYKSNTLFLNPGEICAREKNLTECAIIEVFNDGYVVKYLYKEPSTLKWQSKVYNFKG